VLLGGASSVVSIKAVVDAEKLASMFEELRLGLVPRTVYKLDKEFFEFE